MFDSDGRRIAEYNEATGALVREYVWLDWSPVVVIEGGVVSFIRTDHIGRPVFATNTAGTKVWTASYTPFGGVRTTTGTPINARFPGQWFQSESGLHQNWMRDYDPTTGRYLEADPLGLVDGASVYGYARQNPVRYFDIKGLYTVRCRATSTGGIGYEDGDFKEGSRKICEYDCTRLDNGQSRTVAACGNDSYEGDSCYGVPLTDTFNAMTNEFVKMPGNPLPFDYETNGWWDWVDGYDSDFEDAIVDTFGPE